ncbi:MAG: tryptophanase [Deltaproteobacteria bacterium]|nr:tryptophanase [Deltaproteobacteria bacterium]
MSNLPKAEPYKNKIIEALPKVEAARRSEALAQAQYNPFLLQSKDVPLDFLSDNGASAMSDRQWAALMVGDEAYAGSRNFYLLEKTVQQLFGHQHMVPTHMGRGAVHLIGLVMIQGENQVVPSNNPAGTARAHFERRGAKVLDVGVEVATDPCATEVFRANVDLARLERVLDEHGDKVAFVNLSLCPDALGSLPMSLDNLKQAAQLVHKFGSKVVLDVSRSAPWAAMVQAHEEGLGEKSLSSLVAEAGQAVDVITMSAKEGCFASVGGFVATTHEDIYVGTRSNVVVFEGLHTYGGMAGRDMEAVALGLSEMMNPDMLAWHRAQIKRLGDVLKDAGLPVVEPYGATGVFIDALRFAPKVSIEQFPAQAAAAAIYLGAGVRVAEFGQVTRKRVGSSTEAMEAKLELVALQPPRRVYFMSQLEAAARAVVAVYEKRESIRGLKQTYAPPNMGQYAARFEPVDPAGLMADLPTDPQAGALDYEPFRIKAVESIKVTDRDYRVRAVEDAGHNTFLMRSEDVYIDFLTDSGTSAMSTRQWADMMTGDESPAGSADWPTLEKAVKDIMGYKYVMPVHQGRAGEHILSQVMIKEGDYVPGNMYFTTTREHQEMAGGTFVDVIVDEAHKPESDFPWKGNLDLDKMRKLIDKVGADHIPYVSYETAVNMAGGQPVSMENARDLYALCKPLDIPVMVDATRCAENAYMIQKKDPAYKDKSIREILKELLSYSDGCTISSKKDNLVNIGSFFACNQEWVYEKAKEMLPLFEGSLTAGGMAGRDMAALARGLHEMVDDDYIRSRVEQTQYLGKLLLDAGVPIVEPPGSHAIFLDAKRFLPHLDQDEFPAQILASELYVESGVRAMERGNVSAGRDKKTGENKRPPLELVRLTIPRRVYSREHMKVCADAVCRVWERRESIKGLKMVFEAPQLRFFTARFDYK